MEDIKKPLIRKSIRADTLSNASFLNSFILGQAVRKRSSKTRSKVELSPEHIDLNNLMGEASGYILKSAESTIATPFFITVLAFSAEDDVIMFGSSNGNISRYDTKESKIIDDIPLNIGKLNSIDLNNELKIAAVVGETSIIRIYKLPRFEQEFELVGHSLSINKVIFNIKQNLIFSCSDDSTVRMWDLVNKCEKATILKHLGMCKSLVLSNCGRYVFSGGEDCLIRVFDLWLNEEVLNLKSHIGCV